MTSIDGDTHGVLTLSCPDVPGIVHAVTAVLLAQQCSIVESQQYGDPISQRFFMRVEFGGAHGRAANLQVVRDELRAVAGEFDMNWQLVDTSARTRVVIMVSKFAHCLTDLLYRASVGELNIDVVAVVSNHPDLGRVADSFGAPFRHIPVDNDDKAAAERALLDLVESEQVDLVVLARYMQILSDDLCDALEGRSINIHHSMLPSFKGAKPYHQAHARGVKTIGATAHYVTADLDEGPIIDQQMSRVTHSQTPEQFVALGREVESRALARAVRWHTERRILVNGNRTVVFE